MPAHVTIGILPTQPVRDAPLHKSYSVLALYTRARVFLLIETAILLLCYAWSRSLGHVTPWCNISELGRQLPEKILFRMALSLLGGLLFYSSFLVRDLTKAAYPRGYRSHLPDLGCAAQAASGFGMIGVASCAENEVKVLHDTFASLAFGGAALAQLFYAWGLARVDAGQPHAWPRFWMRFAVVLAFFICFCVFFMGGKGLIEQPAEHVAEWLMLAFLFLCFFSFRLDILPGDPVGCSAAAAGCTADEIIDDDDDIDAETPTRNLTADNPLAAACADDDDDDDSP